MSRKKLGFATKETTYAASPAHIHSVRSGYSFLEMIVSLTILLMLVGLLVPAVQQARSAARRMSCSNHLSQLLVAIHSYESSHGYLPSAWTPIPNTTDGWSAFVMLLPYLDQPNLFGSIDLQQSWNQQVIAYPTNPQNPIVLKQHPLPITQCPDHRSAVRGVNYVVNRGTWMYFDPADPKRGDGAFVCGPVGLRLSSFTDGLGQTIALGEVTSGNGYWQNAAQTQLKIPPPASVLQKSLGGTLVTGGGHLDWRNGQAIETGFVFSQRQLTQDDWINLKEGAHPKNASLGSIQLRSYHTGGYQVGRMDGSVLFMSNNVDPKMVQALVTRMGDELDSLSFDF